MLFLFHYLILTLAKNGDQSSVWFVDDGEFSYSKINLKKKSLSEWSRFTGDNWNNPHNRISDIIVLTFGALDEIEDRNV